MNPSVASVVFGKFCQKRVPHSLKKDDEMESSYQPEHLLRLTPPLPDHVRRDVQVLRRFELEEEFANPSHEFSRLLPYFDNESFGAGNTGVQMYDGGKRLQTT